MRLIDADDLAAKIMIDAPDFLDGGSSITKAFILAMLGSRAATPTIDAVPVVRCKNCKHWDADDHDCNIKIGWFACGADWFCADGERQEGW